LAFRWRQACGDYDDKIVMQRGVFSKMERTMRRIWDGISCWTSRVLYGKLDLAERGFRFMREGRSTCA